MDRYVGYKDRQIGEMYRKIDTAGWTNKKIDEKMDG